jgi:serine/threonine protein phosphatase PrpC
MIYGSDIMKNNTIFIVLFAYLLSISVISYACMQHNLRVGICCAANGQSQEDSYGVYNIKNGSLYTLCDGNGGPQVSDYFAQHFYSKFGTYLKQGKTKKESFFCGIQDVENACISDGISQKKEVGATVLAAYIKNSKLHIGWLGNVRAILEAKKKISFTTCDHGLMHERDYKDNMGEPEKVKCYETARVCHAQGEIFRGVIPEIIIPETGGWWVGPWQINGLTFTRCLGNPWAKGKLDNCLCFNQPYDRTPEGYSLYVKFRSGVRPSDGEKTWSLRPRIGQITAQPEYREIVLTDENHWLVIATNSFWHYIQNKEAIEMIEILSQKETIDLDLIAGKLVKFAIERGSDQNITVMVIDLLCGKKS